LGLQRDGLYEKVSLVGLSLSLLKKKDPYLRSIPPISIASPDAPSQFFFKMGRVFRRASAGVSAGASSGQGIFKNDQETGRILDLFHHLPFSRVAAIAKGPEQSISGSCSILADIAEIKTRFRY
jgi:hypothetical protein